MNIKVATLYSPDCADLAAITNPVKQAYCNRHGYYFATKTDGFKIVEPICGWHRYVFERWRWFAEVLSECDAVFCCGTDVLITNPSITLESIMDGRKPFLISQDAQMPNSDVMLIRRDSRCLHLMDGVANCHSSHHNAPYLDQTAFQELLPRYQDTVEVLPQRVMNSYDYNLMSCWHPIHENYRLAVDIEGNDGQWQPGDFIFHCPGIPYDQRMAAIKIRICSTTQ